MFDRTLIHIYGPLAIQWYGICILIGIIITMSLAIRHPWRIKIISKEHFIDVIVASTIIGILGGRLLFIVNQWHYIKSFYDIIAFWNGGFSLLGSILSIVLLVPFYLKKLHVPILPFLDLIALYAPLLQSIARLGCFFAGCCYGNTTSLPWSIIYTHKSSEAPCYIPLHPTQLYSSIALLCIFILLYFFVQKHVKKAGQVTMIYLILTSIERFFIDFFRADREFFNENNPYFLSIHQYIALLLGIGACIMFIFISKKTTKSHESL